MIITVILFLKWALSWRLVIPFIVYYISLINRIAPPILAGYCRICNSYNYNINGIPQKSHFTNVSTPAPPFKYLTYRQVTTTSMRSKLGALWSDDLTGRHVTTSVKSKPYRGVENVFSIADDEDEDDIVSTFTFTFTLRSFFFSNFNISPLFLLLF